MRFVLSLLLVVAAALGAQTADTANSPHGQVYLCEARTPQSDTAHILAAARRRSADRVTVLRIGITADTAIAHVRSASVGDQRDRMEFSRRRWTVVSVLPSAP